MRVILLWKGEVEEEREGNTGRGEPVDRTNPFGNVFQFQTMFSF